MVGSAGPARSGAGLEHACFREGVGYSGSAWQLERPGVRIAARKYFARRDRIGLDRASRTRVAQGWGFRQHEQPGVRVATRRDLAGRHGIGCDSQARSLGRVRHLKSQFIVGWLFGRVDRDLDRRDRRTVALQPSIFPGIVEETRLARLSQAQRRPVCAESPPQIRTQARRPPSGKIHTARDAPARDRSRGVPARSRKNCRRRVGCGQGVRGPMKFNSHRRAKWKPRRTSVLMTARFVDESFERG